MWFRRDLRIDDHAALAAAASEGDVIGLFVVDPAFAGAFGTGRERFMREAVVSLSAQMGGSLLIKVGDPITVLTEIVAQTGAHTVYVSREYTPYGRDRDARVAEALSAVGVRLRGVGSNYIVDPGRVLKGSGDPYAVFTPFSKVWRTLATAPAVDTPKTISWMILPSDPWPLISERPTVANDPESSAALPQPWFSAEPDGVQTRWEQFCGSAVQRYHEDRDLAAIDGTSRLSVAMRWGLVHPRSLMADLAEVDAASDEQAREGIRVFTSELAWREFYADVLFHKPHTAWRNLNQKMDPIAVDTDAAAREKFGRWTRGETGFGIVDAGMRQLLATGWMHNRVRMIVASFLVKDLHLPWQWGARHFMNHLLDGDLASNQHGWQWAAGTGTDAAPYFRVFNPHTQMDRYDPTGAYCAQWISEWGTTQYPAPMVDHSAERIEALARYSAIRG
jgi:deoxyribodipyrimidine photo-lyase